ncbi:MAG: PrsW family glutamic-type intramembrane protease, partial [Candidatus Hodarchaeota archaeon]
MTQYLSPLLFLGIWVPFAGSFLNLKPESQSIKRTGPSILFASVLVVLGALLLNQRLLFVILDAISGLFVLEITPTSQFVVNELIVGIILPANEEIMKILPIIVIARASIVFFNPEKSDPSSEFETHYSIMTLRQFGFYGIVSGTIFTFLELFLYQWRLVDSTEATEEIIFQILFRTLIPVHILTTFLIALGVGLIQIRLAERKSFRTSILMSTGYFIVGWGFHSLWNTINIYYGVFRQDAESELYAVLAIFGVFIFIMLFAGILKIFKDQPRICTHCSLEVKEYHLHENYSIETSTSHKINLPLFSHISISKLKKSISCPFCTNPLILGTCSTCGASTFVTCPHCNGFISETTSICPHCKKKINPVIELQIKAFSWPETFILGISSLASLAFLIAPISILIFGQMGDLGSIVNPILLFYFLMSLTTLLNVITTLFFNRTAGMLVLFCYFLSLALLIITIVGGFVIIGFIRGLLTQDI